MNLINEKEINVIKENLPKEFLDYLLLKDKSNQILSVSYNGKVMLLEYQQGHIKENLENGRKIKRVYNQFSSRKKYLSKSVGNYKSNHLLVRLYKGAMNSFIIPISINGKYKKEVELKGKNTKLNLTYVDSVVTSTFVNDYGKTVKGKLVRHYKDSVNNIFNECLENLFNNDKTTSFDVWNI